MVNDFSSFLPDYCMWNYKMRPLISFKCMTGPPTGLQNTAGIGSNVLKIYYYAL